LVNVPSITPDNRSATDMIGLTPFDFSLTANSITSSGTNIPLLFSNGSAANPGVANDNPGNGGHITLNLTADGLTIGPGGDLFQVEARGGTFAADSTAGGNGGTIDITASGPVTVGQVMDASTGAIPTGTPMGDGGTVNITSGSTVSVNSTVQVSSNDVQGGSRLSARGGNIHLTSSKSTGVAINIDNTGQLLALLNAAATGPGGAVTILATGTSSDANVKGNIQADRGTIDIRHTGANGVVNLGGSQDSLNAHADVVKVGALGSNGVLTVGSSTLSADSVLKLYAPSGNGEINFIANATLSSGSSTILAAGTVTIQPSVEVNIQGNGGPAQVYTDNPNYSGFGGNNPRNGTFTGNGAANPQPLASAPPFDAPPRR
jgi:hypothetical protein